MVAWALFLSGGELSSWGVVLEPKGDVCSQRATISHCTSPSLDDPVQASIYKHAELS